MGSASFLKERSSSVHMELFEVVMLTPEHSLWIEGVLIGVYTREGINPFKFAG